jgi:ComF family protein
MCAKKSIGGTTHERCRRKWGMEGLVAGIRYRGVGGRLVAKFKYNYVKELEEVLVELILSGGNLEQLPQRDWWVVPVPLHIRRERWRGFNQAEAIGKKLAFNLGCRFEGGLLERHVYTKSQMKLKRKERLSNLAGAFRIKNGQDGVRDKSILLVDDVWTTGATMRECTKVLKRGGARVVWGVVVAR